FKDTNKAHICFVIREKESHLEYNDHLAIHYIELPKVTKDGKYGKLYMWLRYLKYEGTEDRELTDFIENDPEIKNAHDEYEKFLSDEHLQHLYLAREMYRHDEATRIAVAEDKRTTEIAMAMKENKIKISVIARCTGLTPEEIDKL
ncbi:MAG: Rpn family recombination-promoting nuclease/putative transposase, partial [Spirochaetales bacterium]|nr:Rpn family recombination-promoting nuclease/putative transposase [Spirochaetales bacterium]